MSHLCGNNFKWNAIIRRISRDRSWRYQGKETPWIILYFNETTGIDPNEKI